METKITNLDIRELQENICDLIRHSNMPIEIIRLIVGDIYNSINVQSDNIIIQEKIQRQKQQKTEKKEIVDVDLTNASANFT